MNYFEFVEPYYALIKAESGEEAVKKYIEIVAGEDGELCDLDEVIEILESKNSELLIMDGSLI